MLNDDFPFEIAQMADHVTHFSEHSLLPINASLKTNEISRDIPCIREPNEDKKSWKFVTGKENAGDEYQIIIKWLPLYGRGDSICFYRGQQIEAKNIGINNCMVWIDILSGKASTWLTASRDKLRKDAEERLYDIILDALLKVISIDLEKNTNDQGFLQYASLFLAGLSNYDEKWKLLYEKTKAAWLDIIISDQSKNFKDLLNEDNLTIGHASMHGTRNLSILRTKNHIDFESQYILELFITEWLKKRKTSIEINTRTELNVSHKDKDNHLQMYLTESDLCYKLNNNTDEEIKLKYSDRALANQLVSGRNNGINRRYLLMVFNNQWEKLFLKSDIKIRAMKLFEFSLPEQDYILIPFLYKRSYFREDEFIECTAEQLNALCKWIKPKLKEDLSIPEIRKEYIRMIKYLDDLVMSFDDFKENWKNKRELDI